MLLSCPRARFEAARAYRDLTLSDARQSTISRCRDKEDVSFEYFLCLEGFVSRVHSSEETIRTLIQDSSTSAKIIEELRVKMASPFLSDSPSSVISSCEHLQKSLTQLDHSEKRLELQLALTVLDPLTAKNWFSLGKAYEMCGSTVSALLSFAMSAYLSDGDLQLAAETTNLFLDWQEKDAARALTSEVARDLINDPRYRKQGFELRQIARSIS